MYAMTLSRSQREYLLVVCINAAVPVMLLWKRYSGEVSWLVAVCSAAITLVLMNAIFVIATHSKQRTLGVSPNRATPVLAVTLAALALAVTAIGAKAIPIRNEYLGLALSDKPLSEIQPERKRLVVELFRRQLANSRENDRELADARAHPFTPNLYTPESFADVDAMHRTVTALKKYVDIDLDYSTKQQRTTSEFRQKMAKVDPEYLQKWDSQERDDEQLRTSTLDLEKQWFSGVVALYGFAAAHHNELKFDGSSSGHAGETPQEFEQQLAVSKQLSSQLQERVQEETKRQNEVRAHNVAYVP